MNPNVCTYAYIYVLIYLYIYHNPQGASPSPPWRPNGPTPVQPNIIKNDSVINNNIMTCTNLNSTFPNTTYPNENKNKNDHNDMNKLTVAQRVSQFSPSLTPTRSGTPVRSPPRRGSIPPTKGMESNGTLNDSLNILAIGMCIMYIFMYLYVYIYEYM
jgi:hypothetical protein